MLGAPYGHAFASAACTHGCRWRLAAVTRSTPPPAHLGCAMWMHFALMKLLVRRKVFLSAVQRFAAASPPPAIAGCARAGVSGSERTGRKCENIRRQKLAGGGSGGRWPAAPVGRRRGGRRRGGGEERSVGHSLPHSPRFSEWNI